MASGLIARLSLVVLALHLVVLVGEIGLLLIDTFGLDVAVGHEHNPKFVLSENETLLVEFDPNDPHLNDAGQRDRDYPIEKPADTLRIIALGDSVTYGHSVELDAAYSKQLEVLLNASAKTTRYEVINFGVGGYNTSQELEHFKTNGRQYRPDLLMIGYTMNDVLDTATFLGVVDGVPGDWSARSIVRRSRFAAWILDRVERVDLSASPLAYFVHLYAVEQNWRIVSDSFAEFAALARADGFDVLVVIFPYFDTLEPYRYVDIHRTVALEARKNGFAVLDLLDAFRERGLDEVRLAPSDPVHPSPEGHAVAARAIHGRVSGR